MRIFSPGWMAAACLLLAASAGRATTLQVTPVTLDMTAPQAATTIRLHNLGVRPLNAQIRIFRWVQSRGKDRLVRTRDVVASPPFAKLAPNAEYIVRIIRVSKRPVRGEESYRLLVDQLPDRLRKSGKAVNFVLRHSIPVFSDPPTPEALRLSGRLYSAVAASVSLPAITAQGGSASRPCG